MKLRESLTDSSAMAQSNFGTASDSTVDLRDRFQGALVGIQLASIAPTREQRPLQQAIDYAMMQTSAFVSAPNNWSIDFTRLPSTAFLLPACVPMLLRYHHSWQKRLAMLTRLLDAPMMKTHESATRSMTRDAANKPKESKADAELRRQNIAQVLLLGDLLEAVNIGAIGIYHEPTSWLSWLTECTAARYCEVPLVQAHYKAILAKIAEEIKLGPTNSYLVDSHSANSHLANSHLANSHSANSHGADSLLTKDDWSEGSARCPWTTGALTALAHPESYLLAMLSLTSTATWSAVLVAGFLSGALCGKRALPVLWQMHLSQSNFPVERGGDLASELFNLWAGQRLTVPLD